MSIQPPINQKTHQELQNQISQIQYLDGGPAFPMGEVELSQQRTTLEELQDRIDRKSRCILL